MTYHDKFIGFIHKHKLSASELSDLFGITEQSIRRYKRAGRNIQPSMIKIIEYLDENNTNPREHMGALPDYDTDAIRLLNKHVGTKKLAESLGVDRATIWKWHNIKGYKTPKQIRRLISLKYF